MGLFESFGLSDNLRSNKFDLSHEKKLSMNMGDLIPILVQEVLPGDRFRVNSEVMMRFAPLVAPMMHRVDMYIHNFFVPWRLVFTGWNNFLTGGETGLETVTFPQLTFDSNYPAGFQKGTLADYLGAPIWDGQGNITNAAIVSALPFRAYQLIFNEYYRDQTAQSELDFSKGSTFNGGDRELLLTLRKRNWEKDYFTSALPFTQRGTAPNLPFNATIPWAPQYSQPSVAKRADGASPGNGDIKSDGGVLKSASDEAIRIENLDTQDLELTDSGVNVNDLRNVLAIQKWLEKNARAGSRYIEYIWSNFKVKSSDARLQRPEYLGGSRNPVTISEVLNTSSTATEPQGNMAGHGLGFTNGKVFTKEFEEHGIILGILSVLPRTCYYQGMDRLFFKDDKFDFYTPLFANLGEQPVYDGEIYHNFNGVQDASLATFGYQERYAEYRFKQSSVHGDFRDDNDHYHMGRFFTSKPSLNEAFIQANPTHRVFAVTDPDIPKLYVQVYNNMSAIRKMPKHSIPGF